MEKKSSPGAPANPGKTPKGRIEKDPDDLVHSPAEEHPIELEGDDPDDAVHRPRKPKPGINEDSPADPDDLVHDFGEDEEE